MTLIEHLRELRNRLLKSLIAVVATTTLAFIFHTRVLHFLSHPYCSLPSSYRPRLIPGQHCTLVVTGVLEAFNVSLKISLYAGLALAAPIWLYQLWRFVTPGLYEHERRRALAFVGSSLALFAAGGVLAYLTLHQGLRFLLHFAGGSLTTLLTVNSYLNFVLAMVLVFGVSFELPLLIVALNLVGIVSYERLKRSWRGAVFGIFVFAAIITPSQDPFTMSAMGGGMTVLFGIALLIARAHDRRVALRDAASPYAGLRDDEASPLELA